MKTKMEIHILPLEDPTVKHSASKRCKCKPEIKKHDNGITDVSHCMIGKGPDKWTIEVIRK
jgi:hypothetical protein